MNPFNIPPEQPNLLWRSNSSFIMGTTGLLARAFLYLCNDMEVTGLDRFMKTLDQRKDIAGRERGLITGMRLFAFGSLNTADG